jgi:hypothetical protein
MNRILKRPMFRMGGSSGTGITSGLDKPRQGYRIPGLVNILPTQEEVTRFKDMYPQFKTPPSQAINRLLISGGLDLLSRPPQGGTLATAAAAFKEPTKQLFEDIDTERATKFATEADLFKTLIEAKGEAASGGDSRGQTLQIADNIEETMDIIFGLEKKGIENLSEADKNLLSTKKERLRKLTKSDVVQQSLLSSDEYTNKIRRKIRDNLLDQKNPDGSLKYPKGTDDLNLLQDINKFYLEFFRTGEFPAEIRAAEAEGGRIGYQMGGGADIISTKEEPKIDYSTLRARLPKEISDDVVRLISASPEALEDFATIATQSDVDMFNQKYSVNLTLPQEA